MTCRYLWWKPQASYLHHGLHHVEHLFTRPCAATRCAAIIAACLLLLVLLLLLLTSLGVEPAKSTGHLHTQPAGPQFQFSKRKLPYPC